MALYNNLRLFFLLHSLLFPFNLAQPENSPSPEADSDYDYDSIPDVEFVSSPSPASAPTPFTNPIPSPSPSPGLAASPSQSSGPAPGPSLSSRPAAGPSLSSGPAAGPSLSSGPAAGPSPSSGPSPSPTLSSRPVQGPSPSSGPSPGPSSDDPDDLDGLLQFDFSPTPAPSIDIDPKVKQICDSTDYSALCISTIAPFLNGKTDVPSILDMALKTGAEFSRYGLSLAQKLDAEPETSPELATIINNCKSSYSTAVDNYENAIDAIPEKDIGTIKSKLSAVITFVGDCDDALAKQGMDSPFSAIAPKLRNMTSNCLAIVSLLA